MEWITFLFAAAGWVLLHHILVAVVGLRYSSDSNLLYCKRAAAKLRIPCGKFIRGYTHNTMLSLAFERKLSNSDSHAASPRKAYSWLFSIVVLYLCAGLRKGRLCLFRERLELLDQWLDRCT
jgi:hypothetical protein